MKINNIISFILLWCSFSAAAQHISSDKQRVEEDLMLSATVNLSDEALLGTVDFDVRSPLNEVAVWNATNRQFNDLGLVVHIEREMAIPLLVTVTNDDFQCRFGQRVVSRQRNVEYLSEINYQYSVRSSGRAFINRQYQIFLGDWQQVESNKVAVNLDMNIQLPRFDTSLFSTLATDAGSCFGEVRLLFTLAL
ncbi:hypothetical protein [Aeromonas sp. FDAARGOS 1417]|uniref:hypothetical protein n=1 Tax=Aeromonas TaxID=642 RepID=UPI001C230498|nr:hypothetical protein [Aeromonas sp. FDAARGOS 1417]QWZ65936.1 hypothetical protein I6L47_09450 [Aeromonas sp. FDAARGOS 1417]